MKTIRRTKREAKRLLRLCLVNGLLDENRVRQVVRRILDSRRRGGLTLLSHFLHLVKLDYRSHTAEVRSATPLPADVQADIRAGLLRRYGPRTGAWFTEDPALIGGVRIQVGSDVYDGSVRARLTALERNL
jgi:F-type H+-transporting ATPase subunit delta